MSQQMQPTGTKVLVRPRAGEEKTESGIFLPETTRDKLTVEAEVVAVGPGRRLPNGAYVPVAVEPGQVVVLKTKEQLEVRQGDDLYLLVDEKDLLGVIE